MVKDCDFRLQGLTGCHRHQQGGRFSLCTRMLFLILPKELGPNSPTCIVVFIFRFLQFCLCLGFCVCSSRAASRGIALADADELYGINASLGNDAQSSSITPTSTGSVSAFQRLKDKFNGFWLSLVRRWPTVYLSLNVSTFGW